MTHNNDYPLEAIQQKILGILRTADRVLTAHGLRYYITCGTLIGALRHGGFVPWDDDIDICMPRPDYDRFMQHAHEWLPQPYELVSFETDPDRYPLPFAKIQDGSTTLIERHHLAYLGGIYIDVFPLDGMTANPLARSLHFTRYFYYKKVLYFLMRDPYRHGHGPSSWLPLLCRRAYTLQGVQRRMQRLQQQYDYERSPLCAEHDKASSSVVPRSDYGEGQRLPFEQLSVVAPAHPERYLRQVYGDYMQLPPPDKQKQHRFHYVNLDQPYRDYPDKALNATL